MHGTIDVCMYSRSNKNLYRPPRGATVAFRQLDESLPRTPVASANSTRLRSTKLRPPAGRAVTSDRSVACPARARRAGRLSFGADGWHEGWVWPGSGPIINTVPGQTDNGGGGVKGMMGMLKEFRCVG